MQDIALNVHITGSKYVKEWSSLFSADHSARTASSAAAAPSLELGVMGSCAASDDMAAGDRRWECSNNCRRMSLAESVLLLLLLFQRKDGRRPLEGPTVQRDECAVFIKTFRFYSIGGRYVPCQTAAATRTRTAIICSAGKRVIGATGCCAGMQKRRLCCSCWPLRVQWRQRCKADSE